MDNFQYEKSIKSTWWYAGSTNEWQQETLFRKAKKESIMPENNGGMHFQDGMLMESCYEKWLKAGRKYRLCKTDVNKFNFILVIRGTESDLL